MGVAKRGAFCCHFCFSLIVDITWIKEKCRLVQFGSKSQFFLTRVLNFDLWNTSRLPLSFCVAFTVVKLKFFLYTSHQVVSSELAYFGNFQSSNNQWKMMKLNVVFPQNWKDTFQLFASSNKMMNYVGFASKTSFLTMLLFECTLFVRGCTVTTVEAVEKANLVFFLTIVYIWWD